MDKTAIYYYTYRTPHGVISLIPEGNGRYKVMFEEENLGSYYNEQQAVDDVCGGYTFSPSSDIDFSEMGIPENLGEWEKKVFAKKHQSGDDTRT